MPTDHTTSETILERALTLAAEGLPVFPLAAKNQPMVKEWGKVATTDPAAIRRLFRRPNVKLIGVPTGERAGFDVLDFDPRNGSDEWRAAHVERLPETRTHATPGLPEDPTDPVMPGEHWLFRHAAGVRNSAGKIAPGIDVRGEGGYVIWWPSLGYRIIKDAEPANWPDWLLAQLIKETDHPGGARVRTAGLDQSSRRLRGYVHKLLANVRAAAEGDKHQTLRDNALSLGGVLKEAGLDEDQAWEMLRAALPTSVVDWQNAERTARWALREGMERPITLDDRPQQNGAADADSAPVLSPGSPLKSAHALVRRRYSQGTRRLLQHHQGLFYAWADGCYREMSPAGVRAVCWLFLGDARRRAEQGATAPFNPKTDSVSNLIAALAALCHLPEPVCPPSWLGDPEAGEERPPPAELVACRNGLLHLPTRRLLPHTPAFFNTQALDYDYQPDAPPPAEWQKFLASLWPKPEDQSSIDTLQEIFGLLLSPDTSHEKVFLLTGPKRSGRGTIARVLTALLGADNVVNPTLSTLAEPHGLWPLIGKSLAIVGDAILSKWADVGVIAERLLQISGEDRVSANRKNLPYWTGNFPTRFLLLANELPKLTSVSGALASRFILLGLKETFLGREDMGLTSRLKTELPNLLNWALDGYDRLRRRGHFVQPESGQEDLELLEDLTSPIGAFIRRRCEVGSALSVECEKLFEEWESWCAQVRRDHPGTVQNFARDLRAALPKVTTKQRRGGEGRVRTFYGIGLRDQNSDEAVAAFRAELAAQATERTIRVPRHRPYDA